MREKKLVPDFDSSISKTLKIIRLYSDKNVWVLKLILNIYKNLSAKKAQEKLLESDVPSMWHGKGFKQYLLGLTESLLEVSSYHTTLKQKGNRALDRASIFTNAIIEIKNEIEEGSFSPDSFGETVSDMSQYNDLFHTTRTPLKEADLTEKHNGFSHFIVLINGLIYVVNVAEVSSLKTAQIKQVLSQIIEDSNENASLKGIGALTSLNRDSWFKSFQCLSTDNADNIEKIKSAMFVLCLDLEYEPLHSASISKGLYDNISNRWLDKSLHIIIFKNGESGLLAEHSAIDGTVLARLGHELYKREKVQNIGQESSENLEWEMLRWSLSSPKCAKEIESGINAAHSLCTNRAIEDFPYTNFGKSFYKQCRVSPDAAIQLCLQHALLRIMGDDFSFSEAISLRQYTKGRVCLGYTYLPEAKLVLEYSRDDKGELKSLFVKATNAIRREVQESKNTFSPSAHFLALNMILCEGPSLEKSILKLKGMNNLLGWVDNRALKFSVPRVITSNAGELEGIEYFSSVVHPGADGISIGYLILENEIRFSIKTKGKYAKKSSVIRSAILESLLWSKNILNPVRAFPEFLLRD